MFKYIVFGFVLDIIAAYDSGYPAGYLSECPGMNRSTTFSSRTSNSLSVLVFWPGSSALFGDGQKRCSLKKGAACAAKYLNFRKTTKVMISGYLDTALSPFLNAFSSFELGRGHNVIILEIFPHLWQVYPIAARTTKPLGVRLGKFLAQLHRRGLSPDRLEILGGSLGAHIGYYAAVKYHELTGQLPARLTGLDPAGPCFRDLPPHERFGRRGARRVDALHTNIDGFGIAEPLAHVDFYANGGEYQPSMVGPFILPCFTPCSHVRSAFYWISANRNPDQFIGIRCDSIAKARRGDCYDQRDLVTNVLGPNTNFSREGVFFLPTSAAAPYHIGRKAMTKQRYGIYQHLSRSSADEDLVL